MSAILIMDTETTGLDPFDDEIWELAAIRRGVGGAETYAQFFVEHDTTRAAALPEPFLSDYRKRYDPEIAISRFELVAQVGNLAHGKAHIIGAVPNFDTERLSLMRRRLGTKGPDPWHHHVRCVETLALGWLEGRASLGDRAAKDALDLNLDDSNILSRAVGVEPDRFQRHTAMGDCLWARAIHDAVRGGRP